MFTPLNDPGAPRPSHPFALTTQAAVRSTVASVATLLLTLSACDDRSAVTDPGVARVAASVGAVRTAGVPVPGQYIVTFTHGVRDVPGTARRMMAQAAATELFTYTAALHGFAARMSPQAAEALARNPNVAHVEPDALVQSADAEMAAPWNLDRLDQRTLPLDNSYGYAATGAGVSVYILDTGIRTTHAEFAGRASGAFTAINDGYGTSDCNGHGTHVAGIVGGARYGVAKAVRLLSVRVLDCAGGGAVSSVIAGIDWVTQHRVLPAVANLSFEGAPSSAMTSAVQASINSGVVYAVAAGNNAADACSYSPANTPEALTVGATWNGDGMSGYSNFGKCVDLFAPGSAIRSAAIVDDTSSVIKGGTSMAAPHVAGVAALFLSVNRSGTPASVASAIVAGATPNVLTAVPAGTPNLLLYSSITSAAPMPLPAPAPSPDSTIASPPPTQGPSTQPLDAPPVAAFTSSCPRGRCSFDGSASADDHGIVSYAWSFGDGTSAASSSSAVAVSHRYSVAGSYTVTLTVADTGGQQSSKSIVLTFRKL